MPISNATLRGYLLTTKAKHPKNSVPRLFLAKDATFYREFPVAGKATSELSPQLANWNFSIPFIDQRIQPPDRQYWGVVGPGKSGKTFLLETILGKHVCQPPTARTWPALSTEVPEAFSAFREPQRAIEYVGFDPKKGALGIPSLRASHGSARYESNREVTDFTLQDYLLGNMSLNAAEITTDRKDVKNQRKLMELLRLNDLLQLPAAYLSNGQTRRARIAKALMKDPLLLLLDEPFTGLDPYAKEEVAGTLGALAGQWRPSIVLAMQDESALPSWITHLVYVNGPGKVKAQGPRTKVLQHIYEERLTRNRAVGYKPKPETEAPREEDDSDPSIDSSHETSEADLRDYSLPGEELPFLGLEKDLDEDATAQLHRVSSSTPRAQRWDIVPLVRQQDLKDLDPTPLISIKGAIVKYENSMLFNYSLKGIGKGPRRAGLWFDLKRGDRVGLFGPNGCGKTTMVALMTSDHPQAYSQPVEIFGRSRLPAPGQTGISVFDIQARMGVASPEVHNLFPRGMTLRAVLESAWSEATMAKPVLTASIDAIVDAHLRWFRDDFDNSVSTQDALDSLHEGLLNLYRDPRPGDVRSRTSKFNAFKDQDISYADRLTFGRMSFSCQRLALFLRAIIKKPDIVILDEAFSGMDENMRVKAMMFLAFGETMWLRKNLTVTTAHQDYASRVRAPSVHALENEAIVTGLEPRQGLLAVAHRPEEVPPVLTKYFRLPERVSPTRMQGSPAEGTIRRWSTRSSAASPLNPGWWDEIWGRREGMTGLPRATPNGSE